MTGVPAPRDERASTGETPLLTYVANTVGRLEESVAAGFREVRDQLAELPRTYVSQREFDRTRDDLTLELADLQRKREQDQRDRDAAELAASARREADDRTRRTDRWQRLALAIGTVVSVAGVASGFFPH